MEIAIAMVVILVGTIMGAIMDHLDKGRPIDFYLLGAIVATVATYLTIK